ncbi:hypothetical protein HG535_0A04470 [Zygotorulaspora mrakii]|uniref:NADPH--cytochrome P450 reductase n=1 Tax=Zygotorulaspora mrakii TaxID=42260 RepID=A0A7H9AWJ0_ZYGMR|nr:uncharacterized protein HG535_0A04470 [Zygotorulaspora mrakii]QLG70507.1 hypothetical protein HG535_0A04470 [Zygotorulaspora mrakii]
MILGLDNTDFYVLCGLALAIGLYLKRDTLKELFMSNDDDITISGGSRDIVEVLRENGKNYLVLFGSQTGTAEDYAKKFAKELAAKFELNVMCADIEKYDYHNLNELPSNVVVSFFISTYGEGDFPDGAVQFEEFLQNAESSDLENLKYTIFGLGNSTYEFYNGAAKKAVKYLDQAGSKIIGKFGQGDDGAGTTDEDFLSWKSDVLEVLKDQLHLDEHEQRYIPSFKFEKLGSIEEKVSLGEPSLQYLPCNKLSFNDENIQLGPYDLHQPFVAPVVKSFELCKGKERSCIHTEIDISGSNMKYSTGDHAGVWPSNADEKVKDFLDIFNLDPETIFDLSPLDSTIKVPFPTPTTIGAAARHYMEITGPVSRQTFGLFEQFAPNEDIKAKIAELANDKSAFAKEIHGKYYNLADALKELSGENKWDKVSFVFLIETIPRLQPRYYSISSSSLCEKQTIHVTSIVEDFPNPEGGKPVVGVTTNLLRNIEYAFNGKDNKDLPVHYDLNGPRSLFKNFKIPIHVRRSTFKLPSNPSTPVLMFGPGTGVAPFRGFIRERVKFIENQENVKLGKHLLFYGSRNKDDFLYQNEWPEYAKKLDGSFEMIVCHSRLPNEKKVYIQDKLIEREADVLGMINNGAFIYVCGDAKGMAQGVSAALVDILSRGKSIEKAEASEMIKMLKTSGRYQEDVW